METLSLIALFLEKLPFPVKKVSKVTYVLMSFTLKDTSTEVSELEAKVKGKEQMIASLQEEILSMTVRKELLSSAVEKVQHRHQEQVEQVACQRREIEAKISEYAVLAPTSK